MTSTSTDSGAGACPSVRQLFNRLNSLVEPTLSTGLGNPLPFGVGAVVVETTGRRSGKQRRVPLLSARFGGQLLVSTVRSNSQWLKNLEAKPSVRVQLYGTDRDAAAAVKRGPLNLALLSLD